MSQEPRANQPIGCLGESHRESRLAAAGWRPGERGRAVIEGRFGVNASGFVRWCIRR